MQYTMEMNENVIHRNFTKSNRTINKFQRELYHLLRLFHFQLRISYRKLCRWKPKKSSEGNWFTIFLSNLSFCHPLVPGWLSGEGGFGLDFYLGRATGVLTNNESIFVDICARVVVLTGAWRLLSLCSLLDRRFRNICSS
jgi:hypothetical protein